MFEPYFAVKNQSELPSNPFNMPELNDLELNLIKLVAEGLTNPVIAERLYQDREKEQIIKNQLMVIYGKLVSKYPEFEGKEKNKRKKLTELYKNAKVENLL